MSDPIYKASAGEAIVAEQFNAMQSKLRDFINSHTHDGTPDQGPALQGKAIAGQAKLTVSELMATDKLTVSGKLLLGSNNTDVGDVLSKKLDAAGGAMTGDLTVGTSGVPSSLTVNGPVVVNSNLSVSGTDFSLNGGGDRIKYGNDQTSSGSHRALVHDAGDKLTINYGGDYKGGVAIASNLAVTGKLTVGATDVGDALSKKLDRTSIVSGTVNITSAIGSGYSWVRIDKGLFDILFTPPFNAAPAVTVTAVHPGDATSTAGGTTDHVVIVGITASKFRVQTCGPIGIAQDRSFCFIAIGS